MRDRRVFGRSFHEYENEPSQQKKKWINITLAVFALFVIVLGGIFAFILWQSNQSQSIDVASPTPTTQKELQASNWQTYTNQQFGFEFSYPGEFIYELRAGSYAGQVFRGNSLDNKFSFGGITHNFIESRDGAFLDSQGYARSNNMYFHKFASDKQYEVIPDRIIELDTGNDPIIAWCHKDYWLAIGPYMCGAIVNFSKSIDNFSGMAFLYKTETLEPSEDDQLFYQILSTFRLIDATPMTNPGNQDKFADMPLYQDLALGIELRHTTETFTQVDSDLNDPVLANVYLVPREFRTADADRDIRFTVNRNVTSSTADDWITRTLPQAHVLERRSGFIVAQYAINDQQIIVAVQAAHGNLYFLYLPGNTVTETFRNLLDSFAFIE